MTDTVVSDRDRSVLELLKLERVDVSELKTLHDRLEWEGKLIGFRNRVSTPAIETMVRETKNNYGAKQDITNKLYCLSDADVANAIAVFEKKGSHALFLILEKCKV